MHTDPHLIKQTIVPRLINEINKRTQSNSEKLSNSDARLEIYVKSKKIVDSLAYKDKKLKGFLKIDREWAENILYRYKRMKHICLLYTSRCV